MAKLNIKALGLAIGVLWGVCTLIMGILSMSFDYGTGMVTALGKLYIGYTPTLVGSFIGGIWAFFDALIGGIIFAWLYNKLSK